jgi:hypothetical protein
MAAIQCSAHIRNRRISLINCTVRRGSYTPGCWELAQKRAGRRSCQPHCALCRSPAHPWQADQRRINHSLTLRRWLPAPAANVDHGGFVERRRPRAAYAATAHSSMVVLEMHSWACGSRNCLWGGCSSPDQRLHAPKHHACRPTSVYVQYARCAANARAKQAR